MGDQVAVASSTTAAAPAPPAAPIAGAAAAGGAAANQAPKAEIPHSQDNDPSNPSNAAAGAEVTPSAAVPADGASAQSGAQGPTAKTVFMDASDYNVKHPLAHRWCLWFDQVQKDKEWGANLTPIASFETVEDFWGLHNNIIKASELKVDCFFHLFKDGIRPMWEDAGNREGGRFRYTMQERHPHPAAAINQNWLTTMLCLIGEQLPAGDQIQGAHITHNIRGWRIELWTKTSSEADRGTLQDIGRRFKDVLQTSEKLQFSAHASKKKQSGFNV